MKREITSFIIFLVILGISLTALVWIYRTGQHSEWVKENGIAINEENFPNKWLRKVINEKIDKNRNHFLSDQESIEVKKLTLFIGDNKTDILQSEWEHFPKLEEVTFEFGGDERRFNLRKVKGIKEIECRILYGETVIECSGMEDLTKLKVYSEKKYAETSLIVNNSPALKTLYVEGEGVHKLMPSAVPVLKELEVKHTSVKNLDFCSELPALKVLTVTDYFASLNLTGCRFLEELNVKGKDWEKRQGIPRFTLSDAPRLKTLSLVDMGVETLDIHSLHNLYELHIESLDKLSEPILYDLPKIETLQVDFMPCLKKIDFNKMENLQEIGMLDSSIKELNIDKCKKIRSIRMSGLDKIKDLDLRNQRKLGYFYWTDGKLESILFGEKKELGTLNVENNRLSGKLDLSNFPDLTELNCNNNSFREIIGIGHKHISYVDCKNNNLQCIDLRGAKWIGAVYAKGNQGVRVYLPPQSVVESNGSNYYFEADQDIGPDAKVYYDKKRKVKD